MNIIQKHPRAEIKKNAPGGGGVVKTNRGEERTKWMG